MKEYLKYFKLESAFPAERIRKLPWRIGSELP